MIIYSVCILCVGFCMYNFVTYQNMDKEMYEKDRDYDLLILRVLGLERDVDSQRDWAITTDVRITDIEDDLEMRV